jgi:hypothetical protein
LGKRKIMKHTILIICALCFFVISQAQTNRTLSENKTHPRVEKSNSDNEEKFIGTFKSINSADIIVIQKDNDNFILSDAGSKFIFKYRNDELKNDGAFLNSVIMTSNGHIFWRGMELEKTKN